MTNSGWDSIGTWLLSTAWVFGIGKRTQQSQRTFPRRHNQVVPALGLNLVFPHSDARCLMSVEPLPNI